MRVLSLLVFAACSFDHGVLPRDASDSDAPIDADIDAMPPDGLPSNCFGQHPFVVCLQALPTSPVTLPDTINTASNGNDNCLAVGGSVAMVTGVEACVIAGTTILAEGTIVGVFGPRPLVLAATDAISVTTTNLDIRSRTAVEPSDGPNANPVQCPVDATINGASAMGAGGGGAGGSFGSRGSNGAAGANGNAAGGVAKEPPTTYNVLRGGCRGGTGAAGASGAANGGSGGGAIFLVARNAISVSGTINASGAGGFGGTGARGGGGGGGSGGMIVLHAPQLTLDVTARVFANGGGGGGGAGQTFSDAGNGGDAVLADAGAPGGVRSSAEGSDGGTGGFKTTAAGGASQAQLGAGGGGGGVGVIRILSGQAVAPINVSPTPILN